ncbi:hypothetical protein FB45DRAFT_1038856 [Roridomyces roridus]|uniref:Uncharacterized protein n=1 Tax=Roridomyces roridus TaxID=1738132 RepID=A0AAD7B3Z2_9AGAR|nr:hypothetical protein FB45DRAFT_1038856 [Roridomyces roridus]
MWSLQVPRSNEHTHPCNIFFEYTLITIFVLLFLTPAVLSRFPGTAGSALVAALLWVDGELLHGYAVLCIVLAIVHVPAEFGAIHEWLTRRISNRAAHPTSASALEPGIIAIHRLLAIFYHTCIILIYIHNKGVVSPRKSVLDNAREASVFVLRGLGADFFTFSHHTTTICQHFVQCSVYVDESTLQDLPNFSLAIFALLSLVFTAGNYLSRPFLSGYTCLTQTSCFQLDNLDDWQLGLG